VSEATERPAWQRPPFEPGHELSTTHGGYSSRKVDPQATAIIERLREAEPSWIQVVDDAALAAWARAEARCQIVGDWVSEHGELDAKGRPTGAAVFLVRLERVAADLRGRLGLDPLSRARLGRDTALAHAAAESAVERAASTGRAIRQARELHEHEDGSNDSD
jgi:hypothetical protein